MTFTNPKHGGNLSEAIQVHGIPFEDWLDMSTGISPWGYPVPSFTEQLWSQLPPPTERLIHAAKTYYGVDDRFLAPTPGSQLAIRLLADQFECSSVAVPRIGYQEHAHAWRLAGHEVKFYNTIEQLLAYVSTNAVEHVVVINPNNPTGDIVGLAELQSVLDNTQGTLIVDEAFGDLFDDTSALNLPAEKTIVLKSIGKFFGLAGARVGFIIGNHNAAKRLANLFEPWSLSGPSIAVSTLALEDPNWQDSHRQRLKSQSEKFRNTLLRVSNSYDLEIKGNSHLFFTLFGMKKNVDRLHRDLVKVAIWTRRYNADDPEYWLRMSLPNNINEFNSRIDDIGH